MMSDNGKVLTKEIAKTFLGDQNVVIPDDYSLITDEAEEALRRTSGSIYLDGLKTLSCKVAVVLAKHRGVGGLNLNGIERIPEDIAEALAKHKNYISLNGLRSLSQKAPRHWRSIRVGYSSTA